MFKYLLIQLFIVLILLLVGKIRKVNNDFFSVERPGLMWMTFFILEIIFILSPI